MENHFEFNVSPQTLPIPGSFVTSLMPITSDRNNIRFTELDGWGIVIGAV
jgi:hypothetical protein